MEAQKNFKIGTLEVKPGEAYHGKLELSKGAFEVPVSVFCGKRPGQTVLITAGVQAGEYVGIQRSEERRVGKECRSRWSPYH